MSPPVTVRPQIGFSDDMLLLSPRKQKRLHISLKRAGDAAADALRRQVPLCKCVTVYSRSTSTVPQHMRQSRTLHAWLQAQLISLVNACNLLY